MSATLLYEFNIPIPLTFTYCAEWIYYYLDLTPIFMFSNNVNCVAGQNNNLTNPPPLPHPLPSYWMNDPTKKWQGNSKLNWRQYFLCHNIHVFYTSICASRTDQMSDEPINSRCYVANQNYSLLCLLFAILPDIEVDIQFTVF